VARAVEDLYARHYSGARLARRKAELQRKLRELPADLSAREAEARRSQLRQELSRSLYQELLEKESLPGQALEELARRRAGAIAAFLTGEQGLAPGRLQEKAPVETQPTGEGLVPSPLSLGPQD
jgi:hypothetical protein